MQRSVLDLAVGIFVLIGVLALGWLSVKLGRVEFLGGSGYQVTADFPSVGGLKAGSAAEIAGGGKGGAAAVGAAVLLVAGALSPAAAQETKSKRVVLTLRDAVKTAVARSPEMKSTAFDVEALLGKKQQADAARFPQITSLGTIGPSPEAERQESSGLPKALKSINTREGALTSGFGSAALLPLP